MDITQKKRQSILESTNAEIKKLQSNHLIIETFKGDYNPMKDGGGNQNSPILNGINISEILKKNEILTKEISELKNRYDKCNQENLDLKNENIKLKESLGKQSIFNNDSEYHKLKEELEKYKIVSSDRIDLLAQIEEKNTEILDLKKKMNYFENEQELNKRKNNQLNNKVGELENLVINYESKISELQNKIENLIKEKNELQVQNQNKIEILQAKLFNSNSLDNENSDIENNQNARKILEMIYENLNEFENLFKKVVINLEKNFLEIRELSEKSDKKFSDILEERHMNIMEIFDKTRLIINEELLKFKNKFEDESKYSKANERIDWMKKQINELMNYKVKSTNLEENIKKIECHNKKLEEIIEMHKYNEEILQKVNAEKEEKLNKKEKYISNLEARLSDVKDYMFQNHLDEIEEMSKWYKF